ADNGKKALDIIKNIQPDLVLSDLRMPEMDGFSLIKIMQEKYPEIPVIVISGAGTLKDAVEAVRKGAWDYITKPFEDINDLERIINRVLERARLISENRLYRTNLEEMVKEKTAELETKVNELKESEEKFRQVTESINEVFWLSSPDWKKIYYLSPAFEKIWKRPCDEVYKSPTIWLESIIEDDRATIKACISNCSLQNTNEIRFPYHRINRPDGSIRWISAKAFPIINKQGKIYRIAGIAEDITEQIEAEQECKNLENQLRHAQKMEAVGQLAGGIAHDFNNILYIIIGYSEMVIEELSDESPLKNDIQQIFNAAQRAAKLVRQLLLFSRKEIMQCKNLDLNDLIRNFMKMLKRVIGENIILKFVPGLELNNICGDPVQIEQIIMNLCVNSKDAVSNKGTILIETNNITFDKNFCERHPWARPGNYVVMIVSDNGTGIAHEVQEHVFEPFFTTKDVGRGTGLGLAAVYGIVRSHQGMINLYSDPGYGTAFKIYLPAQEARLGQLVEKLDGKEDLQSLAGGTETILLAEDENQVMDMLKIILEKSGYKIISASDGKEAIRVFNENSARIDMALLDIVMPKANGKEVLKHIRSVRPNMPVLFMTGYSKGILSPDISPEKYNKHYEIIQKPISPSLLKHKIRAILDFTPLN
ncbi:response regulator, partial [Desulfobacterales bacterium HSG17]|nr:response regulator [Desulfobacterales bacterium HSG17]